MKNPLIIDMPNLQTIRQRYATTVITFVFWVFWFYLWLPLISLIAWVLGVDLFYERMVKMGGYDNFILMLPVYGLVVLVIGALLILWGIYNLQRFRGNERRTHTHPINTAAVAGYFDVNPDDLVAWQMKKTLNIHFDEQGSILSINDSLGSDTLNAGHGNQA